MVASAFWLDAIHLRHTKYEFPLRASSDVPHLGRCAVSAAARDGSAAKVHRLQSGESTSDTTILGFVFLDSWGACASPPMDTSAMRAKISDTFLTDKCANYNLLSGTAPAAPG